MGQPGAAIASRPLAPGWASPCGRRRSVLGRAPRPPRRRQRAPPRRGTLALRKPSGHRTSASGRRSSSRGARAMSTYQSPSASRPQLASWWRTQPAAPEPIAGTSPRRSAPACRDAAPRPPPQPRPVARLARIRLPSPPPLSSGGGLAPPPTSRILVSAGVRSRRNRAAWRGIAASRCGSSGDQTAAKPGSASTARAALASHSATRSSHDSCGARGRRRSPWRRGRAPRQPSVAASLRPARHRTVRLEFGRRPSNNSVSRSAAAGTAFGSSIVR
jgi:hypothetical protein